MTRLDCLAQWTLVFASFQVSGWLATLQAAEAPLDASQARQWGLETLGMIREGFWDEQQGYYLEFHRESRWGDRQPAFMWSAGVQLTALAAAARLEPQEYAGQLAEFIEQLDDYWIEHRGIAGYDVLPHPQQPDRYYDDNAWIVLGLVDAYEATGRDSYLDRAEQTLAFVLSGEDETLGGGVYWRERERTSKNTCSNAPTIAAALRLYEHRPRPELLATARRLRDWLRPRLQDDDGLYLDNLNLEGRVDRRKFTYNSALMIRAECLLYEITGEKTALEEAQRIAAAAKRQWIDPESGAIADEGKFAHMLVEALLELHRVDDDLQWLQLAAKAVEHVRGLRNPPGNYPRRWDARPDGRQDGRRRTLMLIDQASVARAMLVVAAALEQGATGAPPTGR